MDVFSCAKATVIRFMRTQPTVIERRCLAIAKSRLRLYEPFVGSFRFPYFAGKVDADGLQLAGVAAEDSKAVFQPFGKVELFRYRCGKFCRMHVLNSVHLVSSNFATAAGPGYQIQATSVKHKALRIAMTCVRKKLQKSPLTN